MYQVSLAVAIAMSLFIQSANESYEEGRRALDRGDYREAIAAFERAGEDGSIADAALYWQIYAYSKIPDAERVVALAAELERRFPQSAWVDDARLLAVEVRGSGARAVRSDDEELKLMALNGLMQADEEQAIPILEEFLSSEGSSRLKERALFVLAQSGSRRAHEILARVARGEQEPALQRQAIRYLGVHSSARGLELLASLYESLSSVEAKAAVLESLMIAGEQGKILQVARNEANLELRGRAIHLLGTLEATNELWELYQRETTDEGKKRILQALMIADDEEHLLAVARDSRASEDVRESAVHLLGAAGANEALWALYREATSVSMKKRLLHALFIADEHEKLAEVASNASEPLEVRKAAIHNLGTSGDEARPALVALYRKETSPELKEQVLHALFIQDSAKELVEIARAETSPELKKAAVHWLSLMDAPEARDFLMEILRR
jgi:HEAT repeat protein